MTKQRGSSFIELAIALPVIIFLIFGALEFSRVLRIKQEVQASNDQVANALIRDCRWTSLYLNFNPWPGQACLNNILAAVTPSYDANNAEAIFPGAQVNVGIYGCYAPGSPFYDAANPIRLLGAGAFPPQGNVDPPLTVAEVADRGLLPSCIATGLLAVSHVRFSFSALMPSLFGRENYAVDALSLY
ncbi:MAG: pilus assembly protein [Oligoflexia bacterium]|nr:pilus assembly protein [Oligoflexia bacterium]